MLSSLIKSTKNFLGINNETNTVNTVLEIKSGDSAFNKVSASRNRQLKPVNFNANKFNEFDLETNDLVNNNSSRSRTNHKLSNTTNTTNSTNSTDKAKDEIGKNTLKNYSVEDLNREVILHTEQQNPFSIDSEIISLISDTLASQYQVLPTRKDDKSKIVTFSYHSEVSRSKAITALTTALANLGNYSINWEKTEKAKLEELIEFYYHRSSISEDRTDSVISAKLVEIKEDFTSDEEMTITFDHSGEISGENNKVRDVIGTILRQAVRLGATDVDFDNNRVLLPNGRIRSEILVRTRAEGLIQTLHQKEMPLDAYNAFPIVAKQLCGKDSTKHKDEGTGIIRATLKYGKRFIPVEVRVQFMPSSDRGIAMSMRIQEKGSLSYNLSNNGLLPYQIELLQQHCIEATRGCTFISGSINRGKNCTLIALILSIQEYLQQTKREKHIVLVENPSEFILDRVRQITLPHGKTYAEILDAILRFNPDYVAIGEMRNRDGSAEIVVELANVGHPVFVTVHANSACEVPYRLVNLGIPRFKVVESLNVVTNQILVRKNCTNCTKELDIFPSISEFKSYLDQVDIPTNTQFLRSTGKLIDGTVCKECSGTGFKNRTGVFEVLVASQEIKEIIFREDFTSYKLLRQALKEGFQTIWHNGLRKAAIGEIALSELLTHIPRPTPQNQGLDLVEHIDFNDSQELSFQLPS